MAKWEFDEYFLSAFQNAQKRKQEEEQEKRQMAFRNRELSLLTSYRNKQIEQDQRNFDYGVSSDKLKAEGDYTAFDSIEQVPEGIRNNAFSGSEYPSLLSPEKFYVPNAELPQGEKPMDLYEDLGVGKDPSGKTAYRKRNKKTGEIEWFEYVDTNKGTQININMPKAEKWEKFGKLITAVENKYGFNKEGEKIEKTEEIRQLQRSEAKNELQTTLLPNAYSFFEKHLDKPVSNEYYLKRVKRGLMDDEITPEEAQDLIDASAYRKRIYGIK